MKYYAPLILALALYGCDGHSPTEPKHLVATTDTPALWPTPAPGPTRVMRTITAEVLDDTTGLPVQRSILDVWDGTLTFRLYANNGTGTWQIPDGQWWVFIGKPGFEAFNATIVVSPSSTNFTFRVSPK